VSEPAVLRAFELTGADALHRKKFQEELADFSRNYENLVIADNRPSSSWYADQYDMLAAHSTKCISLLGRLKSVTRLQIERALEKRLKHRETNSTSNITRVIESLQIIVETCDSRPAPNKKGRKEKRSLVKALLHLMDIWERYSMTKFTASFNKRPDGLYSAKCTRFVQEVMMDLSPELFETETDLIGYSRKAINERKGS
jgi:hypothetical protein